jgi:DNA-directed RNA polymerase specialized sigma24 family protein
MSKWQHVDIQKLYRAGEGCPEATTELYDTYSGLVYSEVIKIVKNHEDAQDILQRTFELSFRKVNTLKNLKVFPYWLKTIGRNQAISYY